MGERGSKEKSGRGKSWHWKLGSKGRARRSKEEGERERKGLEQGREGAAARGAREERKEGLKKPGRTREGSKVGQKSL